MGWGEGDGSRMDRKVKFEIDVKTTYMSDLCFEEKDADDGGLFKLESCWKSGNASQRPASCRIGVVCVVRTSVLLGDTPTLSPANGGCSLWVSMASGLGKHSREGWPPPSFPIN